MTDIPRRVFLSLAGLALLPVKLFGSLFKKPAGVLYEIGSLDCSLYHLCCCSPISDSFHVTIGEGVEHYRGDFVRDCETGRYVDDDGNAIEFTS